MADGSQRHILTDKDKYSNREAKKKKKNTFFLAGWVLNLSQKVLGYFCSLLGFLLDNIWVERGG